VPRYSDRIDGMSAFAYPYLSKLADARGGRNLGAVDYEEWYFGGGGKDGNWDERCADSDPGVDAGVGI
jgi:hypothetical protein